MTLLDLHQNTIELSEETWEHIEEFHPEITIDEIKTTLLNPDEIRKSLSKANASIYYRLRVQDEKKTRFTQVVVKDTNDGFFISTATTASKMKSGEVIYKKEDT